MSVYRSAIQKGAWTCVGGVGGAWEEEAESLRQEQDIVHSLPPVNSEAASPQVQTLSTRRGWL